MASAPAAGGPRPRFCRLDEAAFAACPSDSIDYAVMELTRDAVVVPADIGWSDVGSWLAGAQFFHSRVVNDLARFKELSDVIVANRITDDLRDVADKVYSRDVFGKDA